MAVPHQRGDVTAPMQRDLPRAPADAPVTAAKFGELESIRGLAALLVVFFHLPKWNPILDVGIINNSYLMVELFFVLSGFVIFNAYQGRIASFRDLVRFQFLRLGRLYPVHLLFLLAFALIELSKYIAAHRYGLVGPNGGALQANDLQAFAENLLLVSGLRPTEQSTFNGPAWSICVEFYTYLIFALLVLYAGRARLILFGVIPGVALLIMGLGQTHGYDHIFQCLAGFFLGCLTARSISGARVSIPGWVSLLCLVAIAAFLQFKAGTTYDLLIYPLSILLIASLVLSSGGIVKKTLNLRALTWLGAISYSLYMSHACIEWAANQGVRLVLKRPEFIDRYGNSIPSLGAQQCLIVVGLIVLVVIVVSGLVYAVVENPLRERSRELARRWLG